MGYKQNPQTSQATIQNAHKRIVEMLSNWWPSRDYANSFVGLREGGCTKFTHRLESCTNLTVLYSSEILSGEQPWPSQRALEPELMRRNLRLPPKRVVRAFCPENIWG